MIKHPVIITGNNLLFLSESYYPQGWKAFLDGKEIPIFRADYHFRAIVIPPGKHTVVMRFEPRGFYLGRTLSLAVNTGVLLVIVIVGVVVVRKARSDSSSRTEESRGA